MPVDSVKEEYMLPFERLKAYYFLNNTEFRLSNANEIQAEIDKFIGIDANLMTAEKIMEAKNDKSKFILQNPTEKNYTNRHHLLQIALKDQFKDNIHIEPQKYNEFEFASKNVELDLVLPVFNNQYFFQRSICTMYLTTSPSFRISQHINEYVCVILANFVSKSILIEEEFKISRTILANSLVKALEKMESEFSAFFNKYQTDYQSKSIDVGKFASTNFVTFIKELNFLVLQLAHLFLKNRTDLRSKAKSIVKNLEERSGIRNTLFAEYAIMQILDDFSTETDIPYALIKIAPSILKHPTGLDNMDHILITAGLLRATQMSSCEALRPFMMHKYFFDCMEMEYSNRDIPNVARECEKLYTMWIKIMQNVPNICHDIRQNYEFLHLMMMRLNGAIAHHIKTSSKRVTCSTLSQVAKFVIKIYHDRFERLNRFEEIIGLDERSHLFIYRLRSIKDHDVIDIIIRKKYAIYSQIYDEFGYASEIMFAFFQDLFDELERNKLESLDNEQSISYFRDRIEYNCLVFAPPEYDKVCSYIGKHEAYAKLVDLRYNDVIYILLLKEFMIWLGKYDVQYNNYEQIVTRFSRFISQKVDEISSLAALYDKLMINMTYNKKKNSVKRTIVLAIAKFFIDFKGHSMDEVLTKLLNLINEETLNIFAFKHLTDKIQGELLNSVVLGSIYKRYIDQTSAIKFKKTESEIEKYVAEGKNENQMIFWNEELSVNSFLSQAIISRIMDRAIEDMMRPNIKFGKLLFKGYSKLLLKLTATEKNQLKNEIYFMLAHYDNWFNELQRLYAIYQHTSIEDILDFCQLSSQSRNNINLCYQYAPYVNLVYKICPESSILHDNRNCFTRCPEGFKDAGFFCEKPQVIVRKLYKIQEKCGEKCKKFGTFKFWIAECPKNYKEVLTFCVPVCSYGFEDHGKSCKKLFTGFVDFYF